MNLGFELDLFRSKPPPNFLFFLSLLLCPLLFLLYENHRDEHFPTIIYVNGSLKPLCRSNPKTQDGNRGPKRNPFEFYDTDERHFLVHPTKVVSNVFSSPGHDQYHW